MAQATNATGYVIEGAWVDARTAYRLLEPTAVKRQHELEMIVEEREKRHLPEAVFVSAAKGE